jgi:hypothetical protein
VRPPSTNGTAIAAFILSITGWIGILPIIGPIIGIVLAGRAKSQIARSNGAESGEGWAKAAQILGWLGILIPVCFIVAIVGGLFGTAGLASLMPTPTPR